MARKTKTKFIKNLLMRSSEESFSNKAMVNFRISYQISELVFKYKPKFLIMTYEGHAFERLIFAQARMVDKKIICISYQHSVVFRLQHSILGNVKKEFNPDIILTSGIMGKNILKKSKKLKNIPIDILGSHRLILKEKISKQINFKKNKLHKDICLVVPEGSYKECNILFEFSAECAKKFPDIFFIWRLHPAMEISIIRKNKKLINLPKNIEISSNKIEIDYYKSNWVLYRNSTTVLNAVMCKLKPIYLKLPDEINTDLLKEVSYWHSSVINAQSFNKIRKTKNKKKWSQKNWNISRIHCEKFFQPFQINTLIKIMKKSV